MAFVRQGCKSRRAGFAERFGAGCCRSGRRSAAQVTVVNVAVLVDMVYAGCVNGAGEALDAVGDVALSQQNSAS